MGTVFLYMYNSGMKEGTIEIRNPFIYLSHLMIRLLTFFYPFFIVNAVYDATVVFDDGYPSLMDVLHGKKIMSRIRARYVIQLIFRYC